MITCCFEHSKKAVNLRHAVTDCLVVKASKILLVQRGPDYLEPYKWALPGGYVERNETVKQAALREIYEETGYRCRVVDLFTVVDTPRRLHDERQNISFIYLCRPLTKTKQPDHEIKKIKWFDLNHLPPKKDFAFDHYRHIKLFLKLHNGCLAPAGRH